MKTTTKLAMAAVLAGLAACSSNNSQNNADLNATTDMNAGMTEMNTTTEMNSTTEMNATGNTQLNAVGGNRAGNRMGNATTNY